MATSANRVSSSRAALTGKEAQWFATHDGVVEAHPAAAEPDEQALFAVEPGPDETANDDDGRRYARLFHGHGEPTREIQRERPIHRLAACLCAAGMSFREVARRLNVSEVTVGNWFRQKWFQEFVDEEIRIAGLDPLKNLLQGAAKDSVITLIELRDDHKVSPSVRAKCASDLLDRAYGKAPAQVHHTHGTDTALKEMAAVDREINELLQQGEYRS